MARCSLPTAGGIEGEKDNDSFGQWTNAEGEQFHATLVFDKQNDSKALNDCLLPRSPSSASPPNTPSCAGIALCAQRRTDHPSVSWKAGEQPKQQRQRRDSWEDAHAS